MKFVVRPPSAVAATAKGGGGVDGTGNTGAVTFTSA
jgi:hypothetical protein